MPAERAKLLKNRIRVLYICKLYSPDDHPEIVVNDEFYYEPKMDDPEEVDGKEYYINVEMVAIWIFDRYTGEILQKYNPFRPSRKVQDREQDPTTQPPEILTRVAPIHHSSVKPGEHVTVSVVIDEEGNVVSAEAKSGNSLLIDAAVDAVRQWKFKPAKRDGKPVKVTADVTINFW